MGRRNGSDVVVGKVVGLGRGAPVTPFRRSWERADLLQSRVYNTIASLKMFRREFVLREGLRFVEEVRRGEELAFVTAALLRASTISIVADYDCYYAVARDKGGSTDTEIEPRTYFATLREAVAEVQRSAGSEALRVAFLRRHARSQLFGHLGPRWLQLPPEPRRLLFDEAVTVAEQLCAPSVVAPFRATERARAHLLRRHEYEGMQQLVQRLAAGPERVRLTSGAALLDLPESLGLPDDVLDTTRDLGMSARVTAVAWDPGRPSVLQLTGTGGAPRVVVTPPPTRELELRERGRGGAVVRVPVQDTGEPSPQGAVDEHRPWSAVVDVRSLPSQAGQGVWDAWLVGCLPGREVAAPVDRSARSARFALADGRVLKAYRTRAGSLAVHTRAPGEQVGRHLVPRRLTARWTSDGVLHLSGRLARHPVPVDATCAPVLELRRGGAGTATTVPVQLTVSGRWTDWSAEVDLEGLGGARRLPRGRYRLVLSGAGAEGGGWQARLRAPAARLPAPQLLGRRTEVRLASGRGRRVVLVVARRPAPTGRWRRVLPPALRAVAARIQSAVLGAPSGRAGRLSD